MRQLARVIKIGWQRFIREQGVSWSAILVIFISLLLITNVLLANEALTKIIDNVEKRVDVSVYFKTTTAQEDIKSLQSELNGMEEVEGVELVTRDEALQNFLARNEDDSTLKEALQEIGENPLPASLNITAKDPQLYDQIKEFIESSNYNKFVEKINLTQVEPIVDKLQNISDTVRKSGLIIGIFLILIAVLVSYNTIRLIIHLNQTQISIMRLVGSSGFFIQGPYIFQGVLYGVIASVLAFLAMLGILKLIPQGVFNFLGNINLSTIYLNNGLKIFLVQLGVGIATGVISSWIAIRKYIHV